MLCFAEHVYVFDVFSFKRKNVGRPLFGAFGSIFGGGLWGPENFIKNSLAGVWVFIKIQDQTPTS